MNRNRYTEKNTSDSDTAASFSCRYSNLNDFIWWPHTTCCTKWLPWQRQSLDCNPARIVVMRCWATSTGFLRECCYVNAMLAVGTGWTDVEVDKETGLFSNRQTCVSEHRMETRTYLISFILHTSGLSMTLDTGTDIFQSKTVVGNVSKFRLFFIEVRALRPSLNVSSRQRKSTLSNLHISIFVLFRHAFPISPLFSFPSPWRGMSFNYREAGHCSWRLI